MANDCSKRLSRLCSPLPDARRRVFDSHPRQLKARRRTRKRQAAMSRTRRTRLFSDSNELTGGVVAKCEIDRAALSLCAPRTFQFVLAEAVRDEVEENLLMYGGSLKA